MFYGFTFNGVHNNLHEYNTLGSITFGFEVVNNELFLDTLFYPRISLVLLLYPIEGSFLED